ncbi:MAG: hypothetical protein JJU48_06845 [Methylophaga sp.]|nr:hypothetical protein [Methylophaga sp.]
MQKAKDSLFLTQRGIIEDDFAQSLEDYKRIKGSANLTQAARIKGSANLTQAT